MAISFGLYFAELRRSKTGLTLRKFCLENGFDAGNISKLERGKLPPPGSSDKLRVYAHALRVYEGSDEWLEFHDLAAAERGRIPQDILDDAEVSALLPVLFRTLRGDPVSEDKLSELAELLKRS
jgi:transcriptional regulator with XRE-family HTH domain